MRIYKRFSASTVLWLLVIGICGHVACAQTPLKTINNPQGGKIVYGVVDGATTQAAAMSKVLRTVHNNCGEKPQVGKVFKVRGTDSDAVFFTVVNHAQGNKQVAGMVIASPSGPNRMEAAMVSDDASRFGSTVNPMLTQLFGEWHPGGAGQASGPATGGGSAPPAALHRVAAPDNSASVGIPDGWKFQGNGGTMLVTGPNGEAAALNMVRGGVDPYGPGQHQLQRYGGRPNNAGKIVYPSNVDLVRAFPDIFQQFWRLSGPGAQTQIAHIERVSGPPGQRCVHVTGHFNFVGTPVEEMNTLLCTSAPSQMGNYAVSIYHTAVPLPFADKERATMGAIFASFQANQAVIAREANAMAAPAIAQIHAIGQAAMQRAQADSVAHDQQNRTWEAGQDSQARRNQGFSNYLLDQTVIQDNNMYGNGTVGHGTVWTSTANTLVKVDPDRYEIVDTPSFWRGVDY